MTPPFTFPREHSFPPFFTPQPNATTHHAQLSKWSSLILAYTRHHRIFRLSPSSSTSDPASPTAPLFHNAALNRRLAVRDVREIMDFMRKDGRAELVDGGARGKDGKDAEDVYWVLWRTAEEWAALVEAWVEGTGQKGAVLTVYELREGDATEGTGQFLFLFMSRLVLTCAEFHGMDADLLVKALNILVKRGKAQIFGSEDSPGVKFF